VLLIVASVFERWDWSGLMQPRFLAIWAWLSTISAVAFRLWYGLLRRYKITSISIYIAVNAVWGTVLSVLILGERFTWQLAVGMLLIGTGVVLMNLQRGSHERELPPETAP
jgi:drug/metabolite transporter (DMT)-like permease